jgi:hypothetical protein
MIGSLISCNPLGYSRPVTGLIYPLLLISHGIWASVGKVMKQVFKLQMYHSAGCGPGGSVGIATRYVAGRSGDWIPVEARFSACPDQPWGPQRFLYNGYRVFPGGTAAGTWRWTSTPTRAEVKALLPLWGGSRSLLGWSLTFTLQLWRAADWSTQLKG